MILIIDHIEFQGILIIFINMFIYLFTKHILAGKIPFCCKNLKNASIQTILQKLKL